MSASLLFERRFLKQFATVPSDYVPTSTLAEMFVERIANGWNVCDGVGLIPLLSTADENFYLYNPKLSLNKNRVVKMTFSVANLSDQIGVVARGKNTPCNGQGAMYNGGLLQSFRFYDSGGVTFQGFGNAWTATINTLYNLYGYARSTSVSDTTVKSWVTSTTNLLTHLADGTTFTDNQADTQGNSSPNVTGFGPFTQSANDGTKVTRIQAWSVDGTFSACASITSAASGVTLEVFPVDNANSVTVQWYKKSTATGTGAAITGATASIYEYTAGTEDVKEHFYAILTDTVTGATATSDIMPGMKVKAAKAIAVASDSFWARTLNADNSGTNSLGNQGNLFGRYLAAMLNRDVTIVNGAVSGITAADFRDTYMTAHLTACATAGVTHAIVQFGANYTTATNAATVLTVARTAADDIEDVCNLYLAAGITPIVYPAQLCTPYGRARGGVWAAETMDQINVYLEDLIDGSSILAGDTGQSSWLGANPWLFPDNLHFGETANHLAAGRGAARVAFLIDPDALGVPVNSATDANQITIGEAVDMLDAVCRNAGIADVNNKNYTLTQKHFALQFLFGHFARKTKCIEVISDFAITDATTAIDLSGIAGFSTKRGLEYWITGKSKPFTVISDKLMNYRLANNATTGIPSFISFSATAGTGKVGPEVPDADYTGKVRWWTPATAWTPGSTDAENIVLNLPRDLVVSIIFKGGVFALQSNSPEHAGIAAQSKKDYEQLVRDNIGSGDMGETSVSVEASDCDARWRM